MQRAETHLVADGELFESAVWDAVAVDTDLIPISAQDEAAIPLRKEPSDPPVVRHGVHLHLAASLADVIFKQPAGAIETVADLDVDILTRIVRLGLTLPYHLTSS